MRGVFKEVVMNEAREVMVRSDRVRGSQTDFPSAAAMAQR